jgi:menaquinone-9 beta-reductase
VETAVSFDLVVIGGGPAGTSAAITAARSGMRILLVERGRFPRHKVCGEFISAESLTLLEWLLGETAPDLVSHSPLLSEARLMLDGRTLPIPIHPPAASIARHDLDLALWNAAQHAGADVLPQTTVQGVEGDGPFVIQTTAGDFRARAVINASGRWSNFSQTELLGRGSRWLGFKAHMRGKPPSTVDLYFFEGGYCGVQPVRGPDGEPLINVCALLQAPAPGTWDELFACHPLLESRSRDWNPVFPPLSTFPIIFREPCPVSGGILNAGDAAAFVDPFVGDGIALALRGGNIAVRRLLPYLSGEGALAASLKKYSDNYRRQLRPVYRNSSRLRRLVHLPRVLRTPLLALWERSPSLAEHFLQATRSRMSEEKERGIYNAASRC